MTDYDCWTLIAPDALRGVLSADLWALGTLGIEEVDDVEGQAQYRAFFAAGALDPEALSPWRERGVGICHHVLEGKDWLAVYRASAVPVDIGSHFRVDPRDPDDRSDRGGDHAESGRLGERYLLRIPARQAFGTGSHATTRLALTLLEGLEVEELDELDVLDVGTGSGILSFAALVLGARRAVGFDLDPVAVLIAGQNAALNCSSPGLFAGRLDALRAVPCVDVAVVNVLPERIRDDLPRLCSLLRPSAHLISSGNLIAEREVVLATWARLGLHPCQELREGEWIAFVLKRGDGA